MLGPLVFTALLTIGTISAVAQAQTEDKKEELYHPDYSKAAPHLSTTCKFKDKEFTLHLGTNSREDDAETQEFGYPFFWIQAGSKKPVEALPAKEYNELLFLIPHIDSLCKDTLALAQDDGLIAIFARQDNRPFEDELSVAFYAPEKNEVLGSERNLGVSVLVEPDHGGFNFLVYDPPTDQEDSPVTIKGKKLKTSEYAISYWENLKFLNGKIETAVNRDMTWEKSSYKTYFKTKEDFEKAFDWDDKKQVYRRHWIYLTKNPDCMQASATRTPLDGAENWTCKL